MSTATVPVTPTKPVTCGVLMRYSVATHPFLHGRGRQSTVSPRCLAPTRSHAAHPSGRLIVRRPVSPLLPTSSSDHCLGIPRFSSHPRVLLQASQHFPQCPRSNARRTARQTASSTTCPNARPAAHPSACPAAYLSCYKYAPLCVCQLRAFRNDCGSFYVLLFQARRPKHCEVGTVRPRS